jgi:hypothetical protein
MKKKIKRSRRSVKSEAVIDYLSQFGETKPDVLAHELGVSKSLASAKLKEWREAKRKVAEVFTVTVSDGSTARYYELPKKAKELQDLISFKNMNAQIGEIFRATYRYGQSSHSSELRDAKKIRFYIDAEIKRLEQS